MRRIFTALASFVGIVVLGVGVAAFFARSSDGPVGPLPGGALVSGEWASVPGDWFEILESGLCRKEVGTVSLGNESGWGLFVLFGNLADDLLDEILDRYQPGRASILVDDDGKCRL